MAHKILMGDRFRVLPLPGLVAVIANTRRSTDACASNDEHVVPRENKPLQTLKVVIIRVNVLGRHECYVPPIAYYDNVIGDSVRYTKPIHKEEMGTP